ncbi:hypothetical protein EGM88_08445 [Aureibaculum marinum]|uniref:Oligosaccharide repeat unit polymerase n=1 Tax=Aureibaculum marinum TaxID=2487930 RepID=A0A3N4P114_9FLAO|nr:hypothetical protein [Aureibaculum marinum]RPD97509.1 hypothetical protein EGM88_08445 [Aureibaculum marinum]
MIVLILLLIFELYFLNRILKYFILSPIYLYVTFAIISIVSSVLYFYFFDNKFSLYSLDEVSEASFLNVIKGYLIAIMAFILGVIVYYDLSVRSIKKLFNKPYTHSLFIKYKLPNQTLWIIRGMFLFIIILYFITYGKDIFIRENYLPEKSRALIVIIKILSFVEVILLALVYHRHKLFSVFYFFIIVLFASGTGSRVVFLFLLVYVSILFISQGNTLLNKIKFAFQLFLSFLFLAYLMPLRKLPSHGIIPYVQSIFSPNDHFLNDFYFNIYYSIIFGVYVTIGTLKEAQPDWNIIFMSLNPLPGSMVGWYNYANDMRLNIFAPYSLHGRIFTMGTWFTIGYFFVTGLLFSFFEKKVRMYLNQRSRALAFIITLLLVLHIVYGFEYNLRSAFRYIYYAFFIVLMVYLFNIIKPYLPKKKSSLD